MQYESNSYIATYGIYKIDFTHNDSKFTYISDTIQQKPFRSNGKLPLFISVLIV